MKRRPLLLLAAGLLVVAGLTAWWLWPKPSAPPVELPPIGLLPGQLVIQHERGAIHLINPDGTGLQLVATFPPEHWLKTAKLSPDRKRLAYAVYPKIEELEAVIRVKDVDGDVVTELATVKSLHYLFWSPDGKRLYGSSWSGRPRSDDNWRMDPETGERTPLPISDGYKVWGFTPDGGKLLCIRELGLAGWRHSEVVRTDPDEFRPEVVIPADLEVGPVALFPDGVTWVVTIGAGRFGTYTTGERAAHPWPWKCKFTRGALVSPDGSRVVVNYVGYSTPDGEGDMSGAGLDTLATDGSDFRPVWKHGQWVEKLDWR